MEFLVEFELRVPEAARESEVRQRVNAEADASARLAREGHLVRLWRASRLPLRAVRSRWPDGLRRQRRRPPRRADRTRLPAVLLLELRQA